MTIQTLAIAPAITSATQPKPTKTEVIEAMALIKKEQIEAERQKQRERRAFLEKECATELLRFFKSKPNSFDHTFSYGREDYTNKDGKSVRTGRIRGVSVVFDLAGIPMPLEKKLVELYNIPTYFGPIYVADLKKQIRAQINGMASAEERVKSLIESPASRKALEKMLKCMDK